MLRGEQHRRQGSGGGPSRQQDCGLGAVIPTPLTPRRRQRTGGGITGLLGAMFLLGVFVTGVMFHMRADQAATYVDAARLAISPQCGFASSVGGNPLTEADMRAKLQLVVDASRAIWG